MSFVNWDDGEPNNYGDGEDCAKIVVGLGGVWNDDRCEKQAKAVRFLFRCFQSDCLTYRQF